MSKEKDIYHYFLDMMKPTIQTNYAIGQQSYDRGVGVENKGIANIDYLTNYFKKFLEGGHSDELLDFVDQKGLNARYDANVNAIGALAPRGGNRVAQIGNLEFTKAADVSDLINKIRIKSPDAIAQLTQMLGQYAGQDYGTSTAAWQNTLNAMGMSVDPYEKQQDRKTATINSIISGGASALGFYLGGKK